MDTVLCGCGNPATNMRKGLGLCDEAVGVYDYNDVETWLDWYQYHVEIAAMTGAVDWYPGSNTENLPAEDVVIPRADFMDGATGPTPTEILTEQGEVPAEPVFEKYFVVLAVEVNVEEEGEPYGWDWPSLIDAPADRVRVLDSFRDRQED